VGTQDLFFPRLRDHYKPGGRLLFNSGPAAGEVWSNNAGEDLYHASLDPVEYRELLAQNNFKVLVHAVKDPEAGDHTVWIAERLAT